MADAPSTPPRPVSARPGASPSHHTPGTSRPFSASASHTPGKILLSSEVTGGGGTPIRFVSPAAQKASVNRLYKNIRPQSALAAPFLDMDMDPMMGGTSGSGKSPTRPYSAMPGSVSSTLQARRRRLSRAEEDNMVRRLYVTRKEEPEQMPVVGFVKFRRDGGKLVRELVPARKKSEVARDTGLRELYERSLESEAKCRAKLAAKYLGPLSQPKVYTKANLDDMQTRIERIYKGESALMDDEVKMALKQTMRSRGIKSD